jgi:putative ABC transport system permease protein
MQTYLIKNYLTVILRNLQRNKFFSVLNIMGLGIGMAVAFYINLFIINELSYENMHTKAKRIFRLTMDIHNANYNMQWARLDKDFMNNLPKEMPEIEHFIRFQNYNPRNIKIDNEAYKISNAFSVDKEVFKVFDFKLVRGNPETALQKPNSVVLTESIAKRFFANQEAIDKEIIILDDTGTKKERFRVTGIMQDLPSNTHLPVNLLTSFSSQKERIGWAYTYILLKNAKQANLVQKKLPNFIKKHTSPEDAAMLDFPLQNIQSIHLNSNLAREIMPNGNLTLLYIFGAAGIFILLMSAINFINLNAVISLKRMREIGVRMLLGSSRKNLIFYFLLEALLITCLAAATGVLIMLIFEPFFQQLIPIATSIIEIIPFIIFISLLIGFTAGYYPAFVLSKSKPVVIIKGKSQKKSSNSHWDIKNVLVAVQLILCIVLISSALITRNQFTFMMNKNLGITKEQVLAITNIPDQVKLKYALFKQQLLQISSVKGVTATMEVPSREIRDAGNVFFEGMTQTRENSPIMDVQIVDNDFIDLMAIQLIEGRNFKKGNIANIEEVYHKDPINHLKTQKREYIINESALRMIGWKNANEAIGKQFSWSIADIELQKGSIVGVIKDYHQETLKNRVEPMVLIQEPLWFNNFLIKLSGNNMQTSVKAVEELWKKHFPDYSIEYAFLDDMYNNLYVIERKQLELIYIFSALAILIAFLGIFGLLSYTLKIREKEIAIRKVLGADMTALLVLLGKKFVLLTLLGMAIAVPLTWFSMNHWLQNFVYRIEMNPFNFLIPSLFIICALMLTILWQMRKVAVENPANILRAE